MRAATQLCKIVTNDLGEPIEVWVTEGLTPADLTKVVDALGAGFHAPSLVPGYWLSRKRAGAYAVESRRIRFEVDNDRRVTGVRLPVTFGPGDLRAAREILHSRYGDQWLLKTSWDSEWLRAGPDVVIPVAARADYVPTPDPDPFPAPVSMSKLLPGSTVAA